MKVLVTGATGFVGGHLVDRLLDRGDTVTALVRSPSRAAALAARHVRLVTGDLGNDAALADASAGQEVVYHVAGRTGAATDAELLAANRDGTAQLARACVASGGTPRFVLVSSMAAGGPARLGVPKVADGSDTPVTMYGRSKLAAEQVLRNEPLAWVALRPPVVYGPRDRDGLLSIFKAVRLGIAPVFGDGTMELSLIHVNDLVEALIAAGTTPTAAGHVYYVNHPGIITSGALVRAIGREMGRDVTLLPVPEWMARAALTATGLWAGAFGRKTILYPDKTHEFFQEAWTADPSAFIAATGWAPRWDIAAGLADTAKWYRTNGWL